jgi:SSS family solute:Na+ symporter
VKFWILAAVLFYEFVSIVGIGWLIARKQKQSHESFLLADRSLSWPVLAVTMALTVLGAPHILGLFEMSWHLGAVSLWFAFGGCLLMFVATLFTGRWIRRLHVVSMPEVFGRLYGRTARLMVCCALIALVWGIESLEIQGLGVIFSVLTDVPLERAVYIGAVIGILYVAVSGLEQVAWLNMVNVVVKYVGLIIAMILLTQALPSGWEGVSQYYDNLGESFMTSIWGTTDSLVTFGIGSVIALVLAQGISQQLMQPCMAAKNESALMKAMWIAVFMNGTLGVFTVAMGLAAKSIPEFHVLGPKMAASAMLVKYLPGWGVAVILAVFVGSVLSAFAMTVFGPATIFTKDIYVHLYNPGATPAQEKRVARIAVVVLVVLASVVATRLPPIIAAVNWIFAWSVPIFVLIVIGLHWKKSSVAAVSTLAISWVVNFLWSFAGLPQLLDMERWATANVHVALVVSLVAGIGLTAILKGESGELTVAPEAAAAQ